MTSGRRIPSPSHDPYRVAGPSPQRGEGWIVYSTTRNLRVSNTLSTCSSS